jgi:hypothetical protein
MSLAWGPPVFEEHQDLSASLLTVRVAKACSAQAGGSVYDFGFCIATETASGDHFAHHLAVQCCDFLVGEVAEGEWVAYAR